ncbi:MAG TPA: twin-arginine translocase TatA/TatE family subunit [Patescibacteria group bacterium]|nr:twin-arginine translocase TatA/TatE family subunit [Patescibacteria group bacterium]
MLQNFGSTELLVIGVIMLFLFGGRKLPELAKGIGESIREVRKATRE